MNTRELVILLLGLVIVAVMLRGLYLALRARRGQIRLAIDKNIPKDIDLNALELAELPGGGARVVSRSGETIAASSVSRAASKAEDLDLGSSAQGESIPVLMDAVELSATAKQVSIDPSDEQAVEDPDDVLLDYGDDHQAQEAAQDTLQRLEPEYADEDQDEEADDEDWAEGEGATVIDDYDEQAEAPRDSDDVDDYGDDDEIYDDEDDEDYEDGEADVDLEEQSGSRQEPELGEVEATDFADFSMTAGDRIGFEGKPRPEAFQQPELFEDGEEEGDEKRRPATDSPAEPRKSLFSLFKRRSSARKRPVEAHDDEQDSADDDGEANATDAAPAEPVHSAEEDKTREPLPVEPSEVLVINVMAREGYEFAGNDLMESLITSGLKFGDMKIFHQRMGGHENGPVIFSVANILNPGTFDLNTMGEFRTLGVSLFLALPSPLNNLDAFAQMMTMAEHLKSSLNGEIRDDHRNIMTAQTVEHYRQRIRDFELRRLKAASSRGG